MRDYIPDHPAHQGAETYCVIKGKGLVSVGDENADIAFGDAIPVRINEIHSFENKSSEPLEFIIYGISLEKVNLM